MNSKRRYKIYICSAILGELESFRIYKGLSIIFPKILQAILSFTWESENLSDPSLHPIFEPETFRFPFCI